MDSEMVSQSQPRHRSSPKDYELDLVEKLPDYLRCPICCELINNPHLISCCGHHLCEDCIEKITNAETVNDRNCPLCQAPSFTHMLDLGKQRLVNELKVYCPNHEGGCDWTGQVSHVGKHLEADLSKNGCLFEELKCKHPECNQRIQRKDLDKHQDEDCPYRPFSCEHCKEYNSCYKDVVEKHYPLCDYFPVSCPNNCGVEPIFQSKVSEHLENDCDLTIIPCSYRVYGCLVERIRKDMVLHHKMCLKYHNDLYLQSQSVIACKHPGCNERVQRKDLDKHQDEDCPYRPFSCEHCKQYNSYYKDVVENHNPVCDFFPVSCPNSCGVELIFQSEVSEHLENYCELAMIPPNEAASHVAAVEKAIREKGELHYTVGHGALVGPAGSGKSSLLKRLAGETLPDSISPSTGVAERAMQVEVIKKSSSITVNADSALWRKMLYNNEAIAVISQFPSSSSTPDYHHERAIDTPTLGHAHQHGCHTAAAGTTTVEKGSAPFSTGANAPSASDSLYVRKASPTPLGYVPPQKLFKNVLQESKLKELRQHIEKSWTLYLTDTGGQMEFQEVLPLLVSGPSIYFIVFPLHQDLCQQITIEYRLPDGGRSDPYQSTLTLEEAILQTLASVASMGTFTYKSSQTKSPPLKPKVLIVGTHKDQLYQATAKSKIKEIDDHLQKVMKSTDYYREDLVVFSTESQLIFTVNNFSKDDSDFEKIRPSVNQAVCRGAFKMSYPSNWLIFSFVLRQETIKDRIISHEQCFAIAKDCGISTSEELNHALWFLHTKIGLIRYFSTDGLGDIVIRDPQVLFDHITHLIMKTFTFEKVGKRPYDDFKHKGLFTFEDLERVSQSESLLTPEKFLKLLKYLRIVAPFQMEDGCQKYFMPCVLAHTEESNSQQLPTQNSATPPLLISFTFGYCPKGLAGALIIYLLTSEMASKFKWELQADQIFRDQVSFRVGFYDIITLKIHPTYLELVYYREKKWKHIEKCPIQNVCCSICQCVVKSIEKVSSDMNLTASHSLNFYCQDPDCTEKNGNHPAEFIEDSDSLLDSIIKCRRSGVSTTSQPPTKFYHWFGLLRETIHSTDDNLDATPVLQRSQHSQTKEVQTSDSAFEPDLKRRSYVVEINDSNWTDIVEYLKRMDTVQIQRLGGELGLDYYNVEKMKTLPDDMVRAWLRREDNVMKKCGDCITWHTLVNKLKKIGQTGIAQEIKMQRL